MASCKNNGIYVILCLTNASRLAVDYRTVPHFTIMSATEDGQPTIYTLHSSLYLI